jgi:hypothetical protein
LFTFHIFVQLRHQTSNIISHFTPLVKLLCYENSRPPALYFLLRFATAWRLWPPRRTRMERRGGLASARREVRASCGASLFPRPCSRLLPGVQVRGLHKSPSRCCRMSAPPVSKSRVSLSACESGRVRRSTPRARTMGEREPLHRSTFFLLVRRS